MCLGQDYVFFLLWPISVSVSLSGLEQAHDVDLMQFAGFTLQRLLSMFKL